MPILRPPILCLVTDHGACCGRPLEEVVGLALSAGVGLVQLRARELPARQLLEVGRGLLGLVRSAGAYLVVNDRLDVALALGADGVHLGTGSLPVNGVRRMVGNRMLVGASVHS
ncbi:MAG TPA: thiamine phosphate synthase, partial [Chloroflexota bacterium]|nr:thiamine phosphate synthase [Chloroflexota bacterium]